MCTISRRRSRLLQRPGPQRLAPAHVPDRDEVGAARVGLSVSRASARVRRRSTDRGARSLDVWLTRVRVSGLPCFGLQSTDVNGARSPRASCGPLRRYSAAPVNTDPRCHWQCRELAVPGRPCQGSSVHVRGVGEQWSRFRGRRPACRVEGVGEELIQSSRPRRPLPPSKSTWALREAGHDRRMSRSVPRWGLASDESCMAAHSRLCHVVHFNYA